MISPRPSVNHNHTSGNIYRMFANFLDGKTCEAFEAGVDLYLTEKDRFVPDVGRLSATVALLKKTVFAASLIWWLKRFPPPYVLVCKLDRFARKHLNYKRKKKSNTVPDVRLLFAMVETERIELLTS